MFIGTSYGNSYVFFPLGDGYMRSPRRSPSWELHAAPHRGHTGHGKGAQHAVP